MEKKYYKTTGDKIIDFFIGFFIAIGLMILFAILGNIEALESIGPILSLITYIVIIVLYAKRKRYYAILGMLFITLIPLLLFGACFMLLL